MNIEAGWLAQPFDGSNANDNIYLIFVSLRFLVALALQTVFFVAEDKKSDIKSFSRKYNANSACICEANTRDTETTKKRR